MWTIEGRWISRLKESPSSEFPGFLVASYFPHLELKKLQQMHPQLLDQVQQQLDQMFSQLQFNQLQAIPIFIQQTH